MPKGHLLRNVRRNGWYYVIMGIYCILIIAPIYWMFLLSVYTRRAAFQVPPNWFDIPSMTLKHYRYLIGEANFLHFFLNSTIVASGSVVLSLSLGVPAAYALSEMRFKGKFWLSFWVLCTRMAPPMGFAIPFFLIYRDLGLLDTRIGLMLVYLSFNLSLVIWMAATFLREVPNELQEAARIDGASVLQTFGKVVIPLISPGLATMAIFCFLLSWNEFLFALILTRSASRTAPVAILSFTTRVGVEWGNVSGGGILIIIPVIIFSFLLRRYLIKGLTGGAIKG